MKTSIAFVLAAFLLVACMPTSAAGTEVSASYPTITPEWNAAPSSFPTVTPEWLSATLTPPPYYGYLQFPFLNADAGNFQLQSGATITFTWVDPPPGAVYCEIALYPLDGGPMMMLGRDSDPSDGVTLEWTVAPDLAAELRVDKNITSLKGDTRADRWCNSIADKLDDKRYSRHSSFQRKPARL